MYIFDSTGDIKQKDPKYNQTKHDCEIIFNNNTKICATKDTSKIPKAIYNFTRLSLIETLPTHNQNLDILCVVENIGEVQQIKIHNSSRIAKKRSVYVYDEGGKSVELLLWDEDQIPGFH